MARRGSPRYFANLTAFTAAASLAGLLIVAYDTASDYTHPARRPPAVSPASFGLAYEEVSLKTEDGLRLAAWYLPASSRATLILVHGLGDNRSGVVPLAWDFARRGYGSLLLDLRAHGESEGRASTLGLHEVRDVEAAVRCLQLRPERDGGPIGIYGSSLGAAVAIMAAAELPELGAVVADSGYSSVEWVARHQFHAFSRLPVGLAPLVLAIGSWQASVDAARIAPVQQIGQISPRPVMIVHGEHDGLFLAENARLLAEAAREPKEVWIVPGVGHTGAYRTNPERYVERVAGFFDRSLR